MSNLLLKLKGETRNLCSCFVCLKDVRSFKSDVPSSYDDYTGGPDVYVGKSIPVPYIRRCVGMLLVRIIL